MAAGDNNKAKLAEISQAQKERLFHIDFKLYFLGSVNRSDLVERFGIKEAAASRDFSQYKELSPENLEYDTKVKTYIQRKGFKPLFEYSGSQTLAALLHGFGDDYVSPEHSLVPAEAPTELNFPNIDILAAVTRAIHNDIPLEITYLSLSSGSSKREFVPFALVDNGLRWHVRGFDRARERFSDFVINRIASAKLAKNASILPHETKDADKQWNRIVDMHIVPHPALKHPEAICLEYGMDDGLLNVEARAAVAGYLLRKWNVDCTEDHKLAGPDNHLWLKNTPTLYGVENLAIAPGHQPSPDKMSDGGGHG
ncbi:MAG: WYL domain-containing protein [Alphaproteobacteria bacterium]